MTIDEYKDLILEDEINIGYDVEGDDYQMKSKRTHG